MYWAHNAHVQRAPVLGEAIPKGSFMGSGMRFGIALGKQYFAIGTAYGGPSMDDSTAAKSGSVDATLERVATTPFLLVLNDAPPDVAPWLAEQRQMRFQRGYLSVPLSAFDAVAYFDRGSRGARVTRSPAPR
jgi:erythromycin esterase-like protein